MRGLLIALLFVPIGCNAFTFPWTDVGETELEFEVHLVCHYFEKYSYDASIYETDSIFSGNDRAVGSIVGTPGKIETSFRTRGSVNGDEMQSSAYTFKMVLKHNCAFPKTRELRSDVFIHPECPIGSKLCQYKIRVHITDLEGDANVNSTIDVIPPEPVTTTEEPEEEPEKEEEEPAVEPKEEPVEKPEEPAVESTVEPVKVTEAQARPTFKPVEEPLEPTTEEPLVPSTEESLEPSTEEPLEPSAEELLYVTEESA